MKRCCCSNDANVRLSALFSSSSSCASWSELPLLLVLCLKPETMLADCTSGSDPEQLSLGVAACSLREEWVRDGRSESDRVVFEFKLGVLSSDECLRRIADAVSESDECCASESLESAIRDFLRVAPCVCVTLRRCGSELPALLCWLRDLLDTLRVEAPVDACTDEALPEHLSPASTMRRAAARDVPDAWHRAFGTLGGTGCIQASPANARHAAGRCTSPLATITADELLPFCAKPGRRGYSACSESGGEKCPPGGMGQLPETDLLSARRGSSLAGAAEHARSL